ncbi:MAG: helix-turn-helix transcriptional regulator [Spirochaetota bacterium]
MSQTEPHSSWTYLTNHSHVLICIANDPSARLRDLAERVGITERAVQMIVQDLEQAGVVEKRRTGRRNHYQIRPDHSLRHPVEAHRTVRELLELIGDQSDS